MDLTISFPGGKKVDADYGGFHLQTDQPASGGGEGSAPEPFSLFLASIGTCAGIYVLSFCQKRDIPTAGMKIVQRHETDPETKRLTKLTLDIQLPAGFPEKYLGAVRQAAEGCKVKKTIAAPPEFVIESHVLP